jgi:hypothetical protein
VPVAADDNVVVHGDAERLRRFAASSECWRATASGVANATAVQEPSALRTASGLRAMTVRYARAA